MVRHLRTPRSTGFTLVELAAVMVLVAILAVGTAVSLKGQLAAVRLESTLDRIESADFKIRREAIRSRSAKRLRIDAETGEIQHWEVGAQRPFRTVKIDRGIAISGIRSRNIRPSARIARIDFSSLGQSVTYGLQLTASNGGHVWLLACGLSGQIIRVGSDAEFESLWSTQGTRRADTR